MGRIPPGAGGAAQPPAVAPSFDVGGSGIQDARLPWNSGSSTSGAQIVGFVDLGAHPVVDVAPSTASIVSIVAAAVPVAGTPMTLVSSSALGITVSSAAILALPSLVTIPKGSLFIDGVLAYNAFGIDTQRTVAYSAATMLGRCLAVHSAGDDHLATMTIVGFDCYGYTIHDTITLGNNATVNTTKAFKGVYSATPAGTLSGSNVGIGQADIYGLPIYSSAQQSIWGFFNNAIIQGTGTFVAGVTTNPATALTGDVRGTWVPGSASDGTKRLTLWQHPILATMVSAGINVGTFGVPQF